MGQKKRWPPDFAMSFSLRKLLLAVLIASVALALSFKRVNPLYSVTILIRAAGSITAYLFPRLGLTMLLITPVAILLSPFLILLILLWPPLYYANYNAVSEKLMSVPGVAITSTWKHEDVTLEDCGFTLKVSGSPSVDISFHDGQDWLALFDKIDGVALHSKDGKVRLASCAQLAENGIAVQRVEMCSRICRQC
jgi:hypothetical protein